MTIFFQEPGSYTLGDELNPDPTATLTVGQRPHDAVLLTFTPDTNVLFRPGVSWVCLGPPVGAYVQVFDADDAEVGAPFSTGLAGTPSVRVEVACDNGELTFLSIKKLLSSS